MHVHPRVVLSAAAVLDGIEGFDVPAGLGLDQVVGDGLEGRAARTQLEEHHFGLGPGHRSERLWIEKADQGLQALGGLLEAGELGLIELVAGAHRVEVPEQQQEEKSL